jgi:glycogen debranching enzyme
MAFPRTGALISLRPRAATEYISQNRTVLSMRPDGSVAPDPGVGLFVHETRILSRWRYLVGGQPPEPVALSPVEQHRWLGYYIVGPPGGAKPAQRTVEVRLSRFVGDGLHEDVDVSNFTQERVRLALTLEIDADFADVQETHGERRQRGTTSWTHQRLDGVCEVRADYRAEHRYDHQGDAGVARFDAGVVVRVRSAGAGPDYASRALTFPIELAPRGTWHACVDVIAVVSGEALPLLHGCRSSSGGGSARDVALETFERRAARFSAPGTDSLAHVVVATLEQSKRDLAALRLYDLDHGDRAWTVAGGVPTYVALFGRDPLAAGAQAALLTPDILAGSAVELPRWQGRRVDSFRDEEPGRMLHQARAGPLSALDFDPFARSYASITSSAFYAVAVSELWHWTGDRERVGALLEPALAAMQWLDAYGDLDGDGFYEYAPRSESSIRNQGWKDSDDAIVHQDGTLARPPIATCEAQGFVYLSKLRLSELLFWFGRQREALRLFRDALALRRRFNDVFWMPDERYLAMGLDADKRPIRSIASDAGLCLATGIAEGAHAEAIAARLFAEDMYSGWGVRTLSSDHPAYDPYAYHRGTVWPVDQGALALGLARYGLHDHVARLCRGVFEAAALFEHRRLPECFGGHARDPDHPFPALYPDADWPQAWSASSVFAMLQAMLGVYPYAPLHLLLVDPSLPEWLPELTVLNLHVGDGEVDLHFSRDERARTRIEVLGRRGPVRVVRQPSPWSLWASPAHRLRDVLSSLTRRGESP